MDTATLILLLMTDDTDTDVSGYVDEVGDNYVDETGATYEEL